MDQGEGQQETVFSFDSLPTENIDWSFGGGLRITIYTEPNDPMSVELSRKLIMSEPVLVRGVPEYGDGMFHVVRSYDPGNKKRAFDLVWGYPYVEDSIHQFFGLSYAEYLVLPRSVLQSMPAVWQRRFVDCLMELDATIDWRPKDGSYFVELWDMDEVMDCDEQGCTDEECEDDSDCPGQFVMKKTHVLEDPFLDYERGRRQIPFRTEEV